MSATQPLALTPGAPRAKEAGCLCPVVDNRYGHGYGMSANGPVYVIHEGCPMHGSESTHAMRRAASPLPGGKEKT